MKRTRLASYRVDSFRSCFYLVLVLLLLGVALPARAQVVIRESVEIKPDSLLLRRGDANSEKAMKLSLTDCSTDPCSYAIIPSSGRLEIFYYFAVQSIHVAEPIEPSLDGAFLRVEINAEENSRVETKPLILNNPSFNRIACYEPFPIAVSINSYSYFAPESGPTIFDGTRLDFGRVQEGD